MCYVARLKGSMYLVNARLVVRISGKKILANTWLDLRNAANGLQIEGNGVLPGDPYHRGGGTRNTRPYIYIYRYIHDIYIYTIYIYISVCIYPFKMT